MHVYTCVLVNVYIHSAILGLYSLSGKTSYRKISWSLEAAGFGFKLFKSLWNLAGTSAALLPRCLSNCRAIRPLQHPISRLRDFTRFGGKTSYRLVNRGPDVWDVRYGYEVLSKHDYWGPVRNKLCQFQPRIMREYNMFYEYRKVSNIGRTKYLNLNVFRPGLQLSLRKILKPSVKWRMKM